MRREKEGPEMYTDVDNTGETAESWQVADLYNTTLRSEYENACGWGATGSQLEAEGLLKVESLLSCATGFNRGYAYACITISRTSNNNHSLWDSLSGSIWPFQTYASNAALFLPQKSSCSASIVCIYATECRCGKFSPSTNLGSQPRSKGIRLQLKDAITAPPSILESCNKAP